MKAIEPQYKAFQIVRVFKAHRDYFQLWGKKKGWFQSYELIPAVDGVRDWYATEEEARKRMKEVRTFPFSAIVGTFNGRGEEEQSW